MYEQHEEQNPVNVLNRRVHMANERTFLAWIRTSIGIMAFGFVVEKFTLLMRQMSLLLTKDNIENALPPSHGYSAMVGIFLVGLGTLVGLLAFFRYKMRETQIEEGTHRPSSILVVLLTIVLVAVGCFLVFYLVQSTQ